MVKSATKSDSTANPNEKLADSMYQRSLFLNLALNMSWQLAIVVIVPIVGGHLLDNHFKTHPWITIIGAIIAAAGVFIILKQTVKEAAVRISTPKKGGTK